MAAESAFRLERGAAGTWSASGALDFATAAAALREMESALQSGAVARIDLAGVGGCDSAGLACLLAVLATARRRGQALQYEHVPASLLTLARVSGVDGMLAAA